MDIIINELSLTGQYMSYDEFIEYCKIKLVPFLNHCDKKGYVVFKKTDFYQCKVTMQHTLHDLLRQKKKSPAVAYLIAVMTKKFFTNPYWDQESKIETETKYSCEMSVEETCCIYEACERDQLLFSFTNANFDNSYIKVYKNEREILIRSFTDLESLINELFIVRNPLNKSSVPILLGYTFNLFDNEGNHHTPHFHISKNDCKASITIPNFELLIGKLERSNHLKEVQDWAMEYSDFIIHLWNYKHPSNYIPIE
ncbi:DUF4160 domain-containing protein [Enterococcus gilvus]|uniref:DUF4160 domain-containing protein n=1 Tax=Enterococcus gilvus TaxID=160453 RepID=UPI003D6A95DF